MAMQTFPSLNDINLNEKVSWSGALCQITWKASTNAERSSLIPNRNSQASNPFIEGLKFPYHNWK